MPLPVEAFVHAVSERWNQPKNTSVGVMNYNLELEFSFVFVFVFAIVWAPLSSEKAR